MSGGLSGHLQTHGHHKPESHPGDRMAGPGTRLRSELLKCPETVPRNKEKEIRA